MSALASTQCEQLATANVRASSLDIVYIVAGIYPDKLGWQLIDVLDYVHCG